ncbi:hypothetical protein KR074_011972 [Drosophila pseudoananassae]|nr:hypothetical protein KR074_011972 [Drosophila pseudoananassae]
MNTMKGDDKPFNPFYIGPHPSKACAIPEIPGRQCSPPCLPTEGTVRATTVTATTTATHGPVSNPTPSGHTAGMIIVGISGPSGGMANIYSCSEALAAAVGAGNRTVTGMATGGAAGPAGGAAHGTGHTVCKPYPCMEGARSNGPGC